MGIGYFLQFGFAQHALEAAFLVAVSCGLIGPFVITRTMSFAVHGTSELAFTGAVGGLLVADNPLAGALVGALIVAALIGLLGQRAAERDSTIGVILAAGLGLGVFLLGYYHGYASEALNILFGNIFGISSGQILLLGVIAVLVAIVLTVIRRPLLFASVDPDVARANGVPTGVLGIVFLFILAITVTEAAQIVGTLLVLSLAITPAAAAQRLSANPFAVSLLSVAMAVLAADGGILLSFQFPTVKPSVLIVAISFAFYVVARLVGPAIASRRRDRFAAPELAELGVTAQQLDPLGEFLNPESLSIVLGQFASSVRAERIAEAMLDSTARIFDLIRAIKDYSYMDQAPIQEVDVRQGLENTLTMLQSRLSNVEIERRYAEDLPLIAAYGSELNQVWTALLENALDAMDNHGKITLAVQVSGEMILIEVWDNGPGISPEIKDRIFEPFFTTKAPGRGLGLGLDTVQRVVRRHRGYVSVESKPGATCFQVRLPMEQLQAY